MPKKKQWKIMKVKLKLPFITNKIPSSKPTWQWKISMFNREYIFKWSISIAMLVYWRVDHLPTVNQGFANPSMDDCRKKHVLKKILG